MSDSKSGPPPFGEPKGRPPKSQSPDANPKGLGGNEGWGSSQRPRTVKRAYTPNRAQATSARVGESRPAGRPAKRKPTRAQKGKAAAIIAGCLLIAFLGGFGVWYTLIRDSSFSYVPVNAGETVSNGSVEVSVISYTRLEAIDHYEFSPEHDYFLLTYSIKNVSDAPLQDLDFYPYVCVCSMIDTDRPRSWFDKVKTQLARDPGDAQDDDAAFDMEALKLYSIAEGINIPHVGDELAAGETRRDYDIIRLPKGSRAAYFIVIDGFRAVVPASEAAEAMAAKYTQETVVSALAPASPEPQP